MISKNEVKYIQSLSDKKNRDADVVFVAEGPKIVNDLLNSGLKAKIIYATSGWQQPHSDDTNIVRLSPVEFHRISRLETANQVVGIFYKPTLAPLSFSNKITLALDGIQDPGNLGTIIRTADWFGIPQIVATTETTDCFNSKVVQSSMGSIARVNVHYTDIIQCLATANVAVYGAVLNGGNLPQVKGLSEGILVIGNESKGIRAEVLPLIQHPLTIPRIGHAESLNAAVATGIILSHLLKS